MTREVQILEIISRCFPQTSAEIIVGIGDDAAITQIHGVALVSASDLAVEGVHFKREWSTPWEIGARVCAANCADIYAMGAKPHHLLVSMVIPSDMSLAEIEGVARGISDEAREAGAVVVGGDISAGASLIISIAAFGYPINENLSQPRFLRSGARAGETIVISSLTGRSRLGYEILVSGRRDLIEKFPQFVSQYKKPLINYTFAEGVALAPVGAGIDISDGLLSELGHIASASGVDVELNPGWWQSFPKWPEFKQACDELGVNAEELILTGGEDHSFVITTGFPAIVGGVPIGTIVTRAQSENDESGFAITLGEKRYTVNSTLGYQH